LVVSYGSLCIPKKLGSTILHTLNSQNYFHCLADGEIAPQRVKKKQTIILENGFLPLTRPDHAITKRRKIQLGGMIPSLESSNKFTRVED